MFHKVLGDSISFKNAAKVFTKQNGQAPNLKHLGSQADLRQKFDEAQAKGDANFQTVML